MKKILEQNYLQDVDTVTALFLSISVLGILKQFQCFRIDNIVCILSNDYDTCKTNNSGRRYKTNYVRYTYAVTLQVLVLFANFNLTSEKLCDTCIAIYYYVFEKE